jgi:peptide/nickel transport system substrate-binding protein
VPTDSNEEFTEEALSGPVIDRRTTTALLSAAGLSGIAGCLGGGSSQESNDTSGDGGNGGDTGGDDTETEAPAADRRGGTLQAGWFTGSIDTLDPPYISVGQFFQVAANVFNGLVTLNQDLTVRGDLARDWEVTNDGATITFQLREGVTFHNGDDFTAEDVRYTLNRTIEEETPAAPKLSTLNPIDEDGVVVEDDYTVTLNFEEPMAPALIYLTRGPGRAATIVSQGAIEEMGAEQYAVEPVGTGPFQVASHDVGSELVLERNEDYFMTDEDGTQLPYLDGVTIQPIPEPSSIVNALQSGDIHFANLIPLQNVSQVESAGEVDKLQAPGVNWYGLAMNQNREPFSSKQARMGIAKCIDNQAFIETAYFGNAISAKGPVNKATNWVWREDKPDDQSFDREAGMQMLEEAGADGASFSILTTQSSLRQAKAMRQQLNQSGLDVDIEQVTSSTYWDRYAKLDYDVTISGSVGDPDPDQSLWNFYRKDGPWNWVNFQSDEAHELLAEQRRQLDREERAATLQELEDLLISEVPHAYLSHQDDIGAARTEVGGFTHIPFMRPFETVYLNG